MREGEVERGNDRQRWRQGDMGREGDMERLREGEMDSDGGRLKGEKMQQDVEATVV